MTVRCSGCLQGGLADPVADIEGIAHYGCRAVDTFVVDPEVLNATDWRNSLQNSDLDCWHVEDRSVRQPAPCHSVVRASQALCYARHDVARFVDAGTGHLRAHRSKLFPSHRDLFHVVELFRPAIHHTYPNSRVGNTADLEDELDAGICLKFAAHSPPKMISRIVKRFLQIIQENSLWLADKETRPWSQRRSGVL